MDYGVIGAIDKVFSPCFIPYTCNYIDINDCIVFTDTTHLTTVNVKHP